MIVGKNFFDQSVKNDMTPYGNIQKIPTGQGDDYKPVCLLDCNYFKDYYLMIVNNKHYMLIQKQYNKLIS